MPIPSNGAGFFPAARSDYDAFAPIYNRWMAEDFCRRALPVLDRLVLSILQPQARLLDVCCGSGQVAHALSTRGFCVTGIDASGEMLRLARQNAPGTEFIRANATNFCLPERFDAALSTFNSLAHFSTIAELTQVFRNIHSALLPGAPFVFDITMEEAYVSKWHGFFALVADDHACIVEPSYDDEARIGTNRIVIFERTDSSLFRRSQFTIDQKCHSEGDVRDALTSAGFNEIRTFDAQRDLGMAGETGRMFFVCH